MAYNKEYVEIYVEDILARAIAKYGLCKTMVGTGKIRIFLMELFCQKEEGYGMIFTKKLYQR